MIDQHFTPPELARLMVDAVPGDILVKRVADFAAGEGSLVDAALGRWRDAAVTVNDLSTRNARALKRKYNDSTVSCIDFLSGRSLARSKLSAFIDRVDVILLNPPFSQRPLETVSFDFEGESIRAGSAVAFLAQALPFLRHGGVMVAVLPDGALSSQRDEAAWRRIAEWFTVEVLRDNARSSFKAVAARTSIVRLRHADQRHDLKAVAPERVLPVFRGQYQMHKLERYADRAGAPLVHTSGLGAGLVRPAKLRVLGFSHFTGPALLFPRVGRVTPEKVCVLRPKQVVALSDCVFGVSCGSEQEALALRKAVISHWAEFASLYRGTGAPYLTKARAGEALAQFLQRAEPALPLPKSINRIEAHPPPF